MKTTAFERRARNRERDETQKEGKKENNEKQEEETGSGDTEREGTWGGV
jgi:hypothetical protein